MEPSQRGFSAALEPDAGGNTARAGAELMHGSLRGWRSCQGSPSAISAALTHKKGPRRETETLFE